MINTNNNQLVGVYRDYIVVRAPRTQMTKQEALVHAAYLVAIADDNDEFDAILEAVRNT